MGLDEAIDEKLLQVLRSERDACTLSLLLGYQDLHVSVPNGVAIIQSPLSLNNTTLPDLID